MRGIIKSPREVNAVSNEGFIDKDIIAPNPLKGSCDIVQLYLLFTFKLILKNYVRIVLALLISCRLLQLPFWELGDFSEQVLLKLNTKSESCDLLNAFVKCLIAHYSTQMTELSIKMYVITV